MMCGAPANGSGWLDPGWLHNAALNEAPAPGQRVHYRFGSDATGWSATHSFLAGPPPGSPTRFLVFNDVGMAAPILFDNTCPPYCPAGLEWDVGYALNSTKLVRYISKEDADVALLIGDLSYAQGFAADWDTFGKQFEPAFTRYPVMVAPGNHEADWPGTGDAFENKSRDSGGECNVPLTYRYVTPATWPRLDPKRAFYSFNMGDVHFLILDSERPSSPGTPQHDFAVADLASVDRSKTPWIVAGMHRMLAAPSGDTRPVVGDQANMARLMADYEELFAASGVALVIVGHEHAYSRSCPLYKGSCTPPAEGGIVHVLAGMSGAGFTNNFPTKANGSYDLPAWIEHAAQFQNGYLRVASAGGSLLVEAVSSDDGTVFDSARLQLPKPRSGGAARGKHAGLLEPLRKFVSGLFSH
ncbi:hypothetical protein Rsub_05135 [Raphidocelis subcapitata]|uniref:Purple acid phosphatase n=1 Tax=Raphidocelis subcapitata TaxID=307507 RepID=A0A2V0NYS4_9CHLO|nr:hypothetical protein Rsub_05135 [Raphidocelis subcapitata]|eukprot:GBF92766.1 hypothetical protein Rsub_05135 [Raphidocelis subcapitata]